MTNITVKDSRIHGRGVFAARDIPPGEVIIDWSECRKILTKKAVEALSPHERKRVSFIDGQHILFGPPACFVNHSCDANARGGNNCDVATRAIKSGEEIAVNYIREKVPGLDLPCNCGSPNCQKHLRSAVEMAG